MSEPSSSQSSFDGASAVVLGGTGAIGAAVCRQFAAQGLNVFFSYGSRAAAAEALAAELAGMGTRPGFAQASLAEAASIDAFAHAAAAHLGEVGVAVYAAGLDLAQPYVSQLALAEWQRVLHADIDSYFAFAQAMTRLFRARRGGSLVAVTTIAVSRFPPRDILSAAPKAAVETLTRAIAKEEGRFGVRANCVAPGMLAAGLGQKLLDNEFAGPVAEQIRRNIPLQCYGRAEDVAEAVVFLSSNRARYITGQVLAVDGGWQL
ncbi:MAG: SDR family oxidoreductase [Nevskia sp.]|nr:SDR family oxidoreductase [Nevskia sp.]